MLESIISIAGGGYRDNYHRSPDKFRIHIRHGYYQALVRLLQVRISAAELTV